MYNGWKTKEKQLLLKAAKSLPDNGGRAPCLEMHVEPGGYLWVGYAKGNQWCIGTLQPSKKLRAFAKQILRLCDITEKMP